MIIGICGRAGAGKDTIADYLRSQYGFLKLAFADPLKAACAEAFGMPLACFHDPELKERIDPFWGVSPRQIAQFVGTEMFRTQMPKLLPGGGDDFWIRRLTVELGYNSKRDVVVADVRFQNEVDFLAARNGTIIYVSRKETQREIGIAGHESEKMNELCFPSNTVYLQNNGSLTELRLAIDALLRF